MAQLVDVLIEGLRPLLQHRFSEASEAALSEKTRRVLPKDRSARQEAMEQAYFSDEGIFYIPEDYLLGTMSSAGANHRIKGIRRTVKFLVPAAIECTEERIPLLDYHDNVIEHCEVDSRPVNNVKVKSRVMCHRPRFNEWRARFTLNIQDNIIPVHTVHTVLQEAGTQAGIGSYRPKFGRFVVLEWRPHSRPGSARKIDSEPDPKKTISMASQIEEVLEERIREQLNDLGNGEVEVDVKIDPRAVPPKRRGRPPKNRS